MAKTKRELDREIKEILEAERRAEIAEIARGMLRRYSSAKVAMEMAHWHAMDHAEGSASRTRWLRVREMIEHLSKSRPHS